MDATSEYLSDCACRVTYEDLPPKVVHQVERTLVDTLGCGAGAFDGKPASIARRIASRAQGNPPARILGTRQQTSTDLAAFVNTVLVRYLDCNDTYAARGTGHPSDMIPSVLAVADAHRANGRAGTSFKAYPSVIHTQGPIGLVLELRQQVAAAQIASVRVATYGDAVRRTAAEAEKWDPETRETADHSIPYLVAAALQDGGVTSATFAPSRIQDPALRPLIKKLTVVEEPEFTRRYPAESCTRIEVTPVDGRRVAAETSLVISNGDTLG